MESKLCSWFNIENKIKDIHNKNTEYKICNSDRSLKRYYENKDKISNQKNIYFEKRTEKLLQKKYIVIQILRNYIDPMLNYKIN